MPCVHVLTFFSDHALDGALARQQLNLTTFKSAKHPGAAQSVVGCGTQRVVDPFGVDLPAIRTVSAQVSYLMPCRCATHHVALATRLHRMYGVRELCTPRRSTTRRPALSRLNDTYYYSHILYIHMVYIVSIYFGVCLFVCRNKYIALLVAVVMWIVIAATRAV